MKYWVIPEEMSEYDRRAIGEGTPGDVLMERAGESAAARVMRMVSPDDGPVIVFAGPGNNGGDGLVVARRLRERSYYAHVVLATAPGRSLSHDCQNNLGRFVQDGGIVVPPGKLKELPDSPSLVVDALLGTGFRGRIDGVFAQCLDRIREYNCMVLAVDTPSGINGRTGEVDPHTLRADVTVTFAAPKAGLLFPPGCAYTGTLFVTDIGIHVDDNDDRMVPGISEAAGLLPRRPADGHKGTFGRVLLIGGSENMPGAPQLMAMGALRSGVGLVTLAVPLSTHQLVAGRVPEALTAYFLPGDPSSMPDQSEFTAVAAGPGLGNSSATRKVINYILGNWNVPLVLDADALNVIDKPLEQLKGYRGPLLITPHPGEMARLARCDPSSIASRSSAAARLAEASGACILLKGKPSMVISHDKGSCLIPTGNSGMATGGSGDILTGIVTSLMAQGLEPFEAGVLGAFVHGLAGDMAIENSSERSLIASDIAGWLGRAFRVIEKNRDSELLTSGGRWNSDWTD
ncbi:MAG: NAD(P)H-hydrate dehydratase [Candidatus Fermentibacteraceae bacterium]|nr:NAD(P)H-hydrate dehydratase [Candidatus Fermentibacteraceae bacterium]MBN2609561.1 NAD(P)H-hydrate dehydratase [Candidatus Fermentibacteraceae bacterium]